MKKYNINVRETLEKVVEVEAETSNLAIEKVQDMYDNEEVVLDFMDYVGVEITDMDKEEEELRKLDEHKKGDAVYKMINNFMAEIPLWMFEAVYFEERDNLINLGADEDHQEMVYEDDGEHDVYKNWPSWGSVFRIKDSNMKSQIKNLAKDVAKLGFLVLYDDFQNELYLGIDGGGFDFYSELWTPLYELLGLKWHLI